MAAYFDPLDKIKADKIRAIAEKVTLGVATLAGAEPAPASATAAPSAAVESTAAPSAAVESAAGPAAKKPASARPAAKPVCCADVQL